MTRPEEFPPLFTVRALFRRVCVDSWLKCLGTTTGMTAFFVVYFALLRHPAFPVFTMPATWLDHVVSFQPWTLIPYLSLWLYISLLPAFLVDRRQLWSFAGGCLALSVAGYAVYYFFPSKLPAPDIDWTRYPSFQFLKNADVGGNACPSLHAAFAVFTALWFDRVLPSLGGGRFARAINLLWGALIVFSTVATRQHVALDSLLGCVLGAWIASLNFIVTPCRSSLCATPRPLFIAVFVIKFSAALLWLSGLPFLPCFALFLSGGAFTLWHIFAPNSQGLVRLHSRFNTNRSEVWLTIDDGPDPDDTPRLLDLLDRHQARATFFLIGERASRYPELVAEIARRGHEVAHHTHRHPAGGLWCFTSHRLAAELDDAYPCLATPLGGRPSRFRAPMGIKNVYLARALALRGLTCIGWSIRSLDSVARDPAHVAARVHSRIHPGAIILMHEGPSLRAEVRVTAIKLVLEGAAARGYRFIIPAAADLI